MWKEKARHSGAISSKQRRWMGSCIAPKGTFFLEWTSTTSKAEPTALHIQHPGPIGWGGQEWVKWDNKNTSCTLERDALKYGTEELLKFNMEMIDRSHFRFKFWIAITLNHCQTPWWSSVLSFVLVTKEKNKTKTWLAKELFVNIECSVCNVWVMMHLDSVIGYICSLGPFRPWQNSTLGTLSLICEKRITIPLSWNFLKANLDE